MSLIITSAVSKASFIVLSITPAGPLFTHPLQYKPKYKNQYNYLYTNPTINNCSIAINDSTNNIWYNSQLVIKRNFVINYPTSVSNTA